MGYLQCRLGYHPLLPTHFLPFYLPVFLGSTRLGCATGPATEPQFYRSRTPETLPILLILAPGPHRSCHTWRFPAYAIPVTGLPGIPATLILDLSYVAVLHWVPLLGWFTLVLPTTTKPTYIASISFTMHGLHCHHLYLTFHCHAYSRTCLVPHDTPPLPPSSPAPPTVPTTLDPTHPTWVPLFACLSDSTYIVFCLPLHDPRMQFGLPLFYPAPGFSAFLWMLPGTLCATPPFPFVAMPCPHCTMMIGMPVPFCDSCLLLHPHPWCLPCLTHARYGAAPCRGSPRLLPPPSTATHTFVRVLITDWPACIPYTPDCPHCRQAFYCGLWVLARTCRVTAHAYARTRIATACRMPAYATSCATVLGWNIPGLRFLLICHRHRFCYLYRAYTHRAAACNSTYAPPPACHTRFLPYAFVLVAFLGYTPAGPAVCLHTAYTMRIPYLRITPPG